MNFQLQSEIDNINHNHIKRLALTYQIKYLKNLPLQIKPVIVVDKLNYFEWISRTHF